MRKQIYIALLSLIAVFITGVIAADLKEEHISPRGQNGCSVSSSVDVDTESSIGYPINVPSVPKCDLCKALEKVFQDEKSALITGHRIPTSVNPMKAIRVQFLKLPITANETQLEPVFDKVLTYLNAFCSGYRAIIALFKEKVEQQRTASNTKDIDIVLAIPMDFEKEQCLSSATVESLKKIIKYRSIQNWFTGTVLTHPVKTIECRTLSVQASIEGMNAAVEELSSPNLLSTHAQGQYTSCWYAQLFSVRSCNLASLKQFLTKIKKQSERKMLLTKAVGVTKTPESKGYWRCCFICGVAEE